MAQLNGTNPEQVPTAGQLGRLAFRGPDDLEVEPQEFATPWTVGGMVFQLTSDTQLTVKVRGKDGVVRSTSFTLA